MNRPAAAVAALFMATLALCGCEAPRKSAAGFHLPDGDAVRGHAAFVELPHRINMTSPASVQAGHLSRMGDFTEAMTVRQLIDLVAFVHAHTEVQTMAAAR